MTCIFSVELPGSETDALPGITSPELPLRSVSIRFSPARYLRFHSRALTAARGVHSIGCASAQRSNRRRALESEPRRDASFTVTGLAAAAVGLARSQLGPPVGLGAHPRRPPASRGFAPCRVVWFPSITSGFVFGS